MEERAMLLMQGYKSWPVIDFARHIKIDETHTATPAAKPPKTDARTNVSKALMIIPIMDITLTYIGLLASIVP